MYKFFVGAYSKKKKDKFSVSFEWAALDIQKPPSKRAATQKNAPESRLAVFKTRW